MPIVFRNPIPYPIPLKRRRHNDYYRSYSVKLKRLVEFESYLEYQNWLLYESDPNIVTLCEQYPRVEGVDQGKHFVYTFDLYVRERNGIETCIEAKPRNKLVANEAGELTPKNWHLAVNAAREWGVSCRFVTEEDIEPHRIRIANWTSLMPFAQRAVIEDLESLETDILSQVDPDMPQSLESLSRKIKNAYREQVIAAVSHLLHQGRLVANDLATEPLSNQLIVSLPHAA